LLYQRNEESLRASEDRRIVIRKSMADIENPPSVVGADGTIQATKSKGSVEVQIEDLKKQLADLQSRYTEKHPDIVLTKKRIADLEKNK
jgi:uncharacterized protein involved in exopolysaccharide biosynthesis